MSFAAELMELEIITLVVISQAQKNKCFMLFSSVEAISKEKSGF
jgi:hypothetical protein